MAKTIYEGYRVGKNGGERWTGTVQRQERAGRFETTANSGKTPMMERLKMPKGGSVISIDRPQKSTD